MKALAILAGAFTLATSAHAWTVEPKLENVASLFAGRPVKVKCYDKEEPGSPWGYDAWGYVWKPLGKQKFMHLDARMCVGALNLNDTSLPTWQRAIGVLVVTHEAYHLRRWGAADSEAKVECKAIRHWKVAARLLGASEATVTELWPSALAAHYRISEYKDLYGERPYYDETCVVPPLLPPEVLDG